MKNKKLKDILFYVTLLPYIILLFMCIYYAIIGYGLYLGNTAYGINAIGNFLSDVYNDFIWDCIFNPIGICIIILWIGYQIYYFITSRRVKTEKKDYSNESNRNKKISFKKILFFISILCWIIYFASGIFAFFFGSNTGGGLFSSTREYGIDAMVNTLFINLVTFTLIPILPISLLYIIIYLIVKKKERKK